MEFSPEKQSIAQLLEWKKKQLLVVNPEYQRGSVWTKTQQKKLVDSVLRGYPLPLIYFHYVVEKDGDLQNQRYEIIDGQQRINALADYCQGAFRLFDPVRDAAEARFPDFIKRQPCPWGGKGFSDLPAALQEQLRNTLLQIVKIETDDANEARDLFVRLQAGMPLNSQEKRDAWPGQFTDFILRLGGKQGLARYPGHDFFNELMNAKKTKDRGKVRQLAAQIAMLFLTHRKSGAFCDINAQAIDDYYYENLDFDAESELAHRLNEVLDKINLLLRDHNGPRIVGHEAIHLVLLVDTLMDGYTRSWEAKLGPSFDHFRERLAKAKLTRHDPAPDDFWLRYGVGTRVNSDRRDTIQRRHEFFLEMMLPLLNLQKKDPQRAFGALERELIYYRDNKKCAVCEEEIDWAELETHHVTEHAQGGATALENGVSVHRHHHPKGQDAIEFARRWRQRGAPKGPSEEDVLAAAQDDSDDGDSSR